MSPDQIRAQFPGYAGWGTPEMLADFAATGGQGKGGPAGGDGGSSGGGGGGPSIPPPFSFDYVKEAEKAYGELGAYYDRILQESKGDVNKALARLVEDYDRGIRIKREDTATNMEDIDLAKKEADRLAGIRDAGQAVSDERAMQSEIESANARGLYQTSAAGGGGRGLGDRGIEDLQKQVAMREQAEAGDLTYADQQRDRQIEAIKRGTSRYEEEAGINKTRRETDLAEEQKRYEFDLEQKRRKEAADLANERGSQSYENYKYSLF